MPVAKLSTIGALDSMKSGDGNEPLDTFIRQTIVREPLLSFSRTGDSPVQWIQLLHALDQQELPGWPLLTPLKVQMQKCEKCSREFCSSVNYRRHIRVHRRSLNVNKESHKIRDMLATFWDKLSLEEAKEVVSFKDVMLKEVPGSSVVKALASSIRKPGIWTLPQFYVKAGDMLLDIIYAKPSRLPISSHELFSILDDASERTFLSAGTAESVQKYVFDGEAEKVVLELKNLVACTSFLFEQRLVKAWLADKDAEALRCQKLLVEEEEAAQKRQAELLERKKQKKLRQKEQKAREQSNGEKVALDIDSDSREISFLAEACCPPGPFDNFDAPDVIANMIYSEPVEYSNNEANMDIEAQVDINNCLNPASCQNTEPLMVSVNPRRRWQVSKLQRFGRNGFHGNHNFQVPKLESTHKHITSRDRGTPVNHVKVWTKKFKMGNTVESLRPSLDEGAKCELIIGSISVPVKSSIFRKNDLSLGERNRCKKSNDLEESANSDNNQSGVNCASARQRRPLGRHEKKSPSPVERDNQDSDNAVILEKLDDRTSFDGSCLPLSALEDDSNKIGECSRAVHEGITLPLVSEFSSDAAKVFLAERWKEAISEDHVKLVLSPDPDLPGGAQRVDNFSTVAVRSASHESIILANADNWLPVAGPFSTVSGNAKSNIRTNSDKGVKMYVPKHKVTA